jgi:hypothetical protein
MPKFVIERNIPGASTLSAQELREIRARPAEAGSAPSRGEYCAGGAFIKLPACTN